MKRGLAGRTRRGSPPLPRQRMALRVLQLTLLGLALFLGSMAAKAWGVEPAGQVVVLAALGAGSAVLAAMLGFRTVRGPEPPSLD